MANLSIDQLRLIKKIEDFNSNDTQINLFYFPSVDGVSTQLLESLLFRLENLPNQSYIYLGDGTAVRKRLVNESFFVESDIGKNRSDVLAERYSDLFKTKVYSGNRNRNVSLHDLLSPEVNLFYISTNTQKETSYIEKLRTLKTTSDVRHGQVYMFNLTDQNEGFALQFHEIKNNKINGDLEQVNEETVSVTATNAFIKNSIMSQTIFNMINNIITSEMNVNYTKLSGEIFGTEQMERSFIFGLPDNALFNQIEVPSVMEYPMPVLAKYNSEYERYNNSKGQDYDVFLKSVEESINSFSTVEFLINGMSNMLNIMLTNHDNNDFADTLSPHKKEVFEEITQNLEKYKLFHDFLRGVCSGYSHDTITMLKVYNFLESTLGSPLQF